MKNYLLAMTLLFLSNSVSAATHSPNIEMLSAIQQRDIQKVYQLLKLKVNPSGEVKARLTVRSDVAGYDSLRPKPIGSYINGIFNAQTPRTWIITGSYLCGAVIVNDLQIATALLESGADANRECQINTSNHWGFESKSSPLDLAVSYVGNPEMITLLLKFKADPSNKFKHGINNHRTSVAENYARNLSSQDAAVKEFCAPPSPNAFPTAPGCTECQEAYCAKHRSVLEKLKLVGTALSAQ